MGRMKKGLGHNGKNCFSRIIKYKFKDDFSFDVHKNFKKSDDEDDSYSIVFSVVNSDQKLFDLLRNYNKYVPLIDSVLHTEIKSLRKN